MTLFKDTPLTFVHPFYNDGADRIPLLLEAWASYPDWVWDNISVVLIDDCSNPPLLGHFPKDNDLNINLRVYRIKEDLKYNLPGAWNLGFHVVDTEWVYALDSDHFHTKENLVKLLTEVEAVDNVFYQARRNRISSIPDKSWVTTPASGSWLIQRKAWEKVYGFDEELTGARSNSWGAWEWDFTSRLYETGGLTRTVLTDIQVEEYCPDWFGYTDDPHFGLDKTTNKRRYRYKQQGLVEHPTEMLRFEWEKVHEQRRT